jgi:hypothetical protein
MGLCNRTRYTVRRGDRCVRIAAIMKNGIVAYTNGRGRHRRPMIEGNAHAVRRRECRPVEIRLARSEARAEPSTVDLE